MGQGQALCLAPKLGRKLVKEHTQLVAEGLEEAATADPLGGDHGVGTARAHSAPWSSRPCFQSTRALLSDWSIHCPRGLHEAS